MKNIPFGLAVEAALKMRDGQIKNEEELEAYIDRKTNERKQQAIKANKVKRENMKNFIKNRRKK